MRVRGLKRVQMGKEVGMRWKIKSHREETSEVFKHSSRPVLTCSWRCEVKTGEA